MSDTYRAVIRGVDPDEVAVSLRAAGATRSGEDSTRELYSVRACHVELYQEEGWTMLVNGADEGDVRDTLAQLGHDPYLPLQTVGTRL